MAQQQQDNDGGDIALMIFAAGSAAIVLVIIVILGIEILGNGSIGGSQASKAAIPYSIDTRPIPNAKTLPQIFPQKLGNFMRGPINGSFASFSMNYISGSDVILLKGSQAVSFLAGQANVLQITAVNGRANQSQGSDTSTFRYSFYFNVLDTQVRFAWSHDTWFYDISTATTGTLDNFMAAFPY